ncbi:hypothetical protein [Rhodoferax sp.]|uniref:hypothetical protein n=1 Tax=Rhodoferax sp. TaxID=50421 RepID=UPI0027566CCF|nr:hypothetical protein [Rhodoferax sp.]
MNTSTKWLVRLGPQEWSRYTYARPSGDPLHLIGSVKRGLQVGALGVTREKQYVQVVGDFVTPLNSSQLARAIAKEQARDPYGAQHLVRAAPAPVVTIKRRRVPIAA